MRAMAIDSLGSAAAGAARALDGLDMLEALGGQTVELDQTDRINLRRALRYLRKVGGLSPRTLEQVFGKGTPREAAMGYIPRTTSAGAHMASCRDTYPVQTEVSRRSIAGRRFAYHAPGLSVTGRDSGAPYAGSFAKPVKLEEGGYFYRGNTYDDLGALEGAILRGKTGGAAANQYTLLGRGISPVQTGIPGAMTLLGSAGPNTTDLLGSIFNQSQGISGGIPANAPVPGGSSATPSAILGTNLPLEDKVLMLGASMSSSIDSEIEAKMKQIEAAMGGGGTGTSQTGPAHGGLAGGGATGDGTTATGQTGTGSEQSPNLQLLQTQLQQLIQQRTQMFQMMQNILKTLHDTSMAAIRNMKA